jgi:hypothetical protein
LTGPTLSAHAGHHLPADHSAGDERTLGGYMAVHARPAAFEGVDGMSYSADILTDTTGDPGAPWGAFLFFLRWGYGEPEAVGHLETEFLVRGQSEAAVRDELGRMSLLVVKATLDGLIRGQSAAASERGNG